MEKIIVYFAHPMEGLSIPDESGQRAYEARKLLGDNYEVLIPEDWQHEVSDHRDIETIDLYENLIKADVILADFYRMGLIRNERTVLGRGTNQEVGFIKGCNFLLDQCGMKTIPIVQIIRQHNEENYHPFDKEHRGLINCNSLTDACDKIKEIFDV